METRGWLKPYWPHNFNTTQIADLLNFVLRSNKFQFDGAMYEQ